MAARYSSLILRSSLSTRSLCEDLPSGEPSAGRSAVGAAKSSVTAGSALATSTTTISAPRVAGGSVWVVAALLSADVLLSEEAGAAGFVFCLCLLLLCSFLDGLCALLGCGAGAGGPPPAPRLWNRARSVSQGLSSAFSSASISPGSSNVPPLRLPSEMEWTSSPPSRLLSTAWEDSGPASEVSSPKGLVELDASGSDSRSGVASQAEGGESEGSAGVFSDPAGLGAAWGAAGPAIPMDASATSCRIVAEIA